MTPPGHDRPGPRPDPRALRPNTQVPAPKQAARLPLAGATHSGGASAASFLALQRSVGNRATGRLLDPEHEPARTDRSAASPHPTDANPSVGTFMGAPPRHALVVGAAPVQRQGTKTKSKSKSKSKAKKVNHATGKEVDAFLVANAFLKPFVQPKMKGGTKAEGAVTIHDAAAFKKAWVAYALKRTNPVTGKIFTKAEATAWETTVNAFQGDDKIHIHESRGERGTAIHESMHLFSSTDFTNTVGFNVNEGSTEYFTRLVTKQQKISRGTFYPSQLKSVTKLVGVSSETKLANAYFKNELGPLKKDVNAKAKKGEKVTRWDLWLTNMKAGTYAKADKQLT